MYRLALELLVSIAIVMGIMILAATLLGHPAYGAPEPWQMGCKIRTGVGVTTIVIGSMSVGSCLGFLFAAMAHCGGDRP
jgi:hypothetical protein